MYVINWCHSQSTEEPCNTSRLHENWVNKQMCGSYEQNFTTVIYTGIYSTTSKAFIFLVILSKVYYIGRWRQRFFRTFISGAPPVSRVSQRILVRSSKVSLATLSNSYFHCFLFPSVYWLQHVLNYFYRLNLYFLLKLKMRENLLAPIGMNGLFI